MVSLWWWWEVYGGGKFMVAWEVYSGGGRFIVVVGGLMVEVVGI